MHVRPSDGKIGEKCIPNFWIHINLFFSNPTNIIKVCEDGRLLLFHAKSTEGISSYDEF